VTAGVERTWPWRTDNVERVKMRKRLLVGSLAVSAVASVAIGFAIARSHHSSTDTAVLGGTGPTVVEPGGIPTNAAVSGTPLPKVTVQTLQGDDVKTADLLGHPMVINVWGSTCGPCKRELPDFAKVQQVYGDRVRFVGMDYLPPSDHEEKFARDKGVKYELLYDGKGEFVGAAGVAAFPVTLFVRPDGTIVKQTGQLDAAKLTTLIEDELL
jgi:thiol-disulfide isomerase/thioredoxin